MSISETSTATLLTVTGRASLLRPSTTLGIRQVGDTDTGVIEDVEFTGAGQYVFFEVTQLEDHGNRDRAWTAPVWFEATAAGPDRGSDVEIIRLLPNPSGDEQQNESITLKNFGSSPVSLIGWTVRDAVGNTWDLSSLGSVSAGDEVIILRSGQSMALNNSGDTVDLIDDQGEVLHTVEYDRADTDEVIEIRRDL